MLRRLGFGLLFALVAFFGAAFASYFLISTFSSNMHDRSVVVAMTSMFFFGPAGAVLGFIGGWIFGGRRPNAPSEHA